MKKLILVLCLLPSIAFALPGGSGKRCSLGGDGGRVLKAKALNGSGLTFQFDRNTRCKDPALWNWLELEIDFTHATSGNVLITCTVGRDKDNDDFTPQTCAGAGTCVMLDGGILSKAVTGNKKYAGRIGISGYTAWSCTASHDNTPAAGDIISVWAHLTD